MSDDVTTKHIRGFTITKGRSYGMFTVMISNDDAELLDAMYEKILEILTK